MRALTLGMGGEDVTRWERFLIRAKLLEVAPSGFFGPQVAAATSGFQRAAGLEETGSADGATLARALEQGLLDRALDEPAQRAEAAPKASRWSALTPVMVAVAAALGTLLTNIGVEFFKHQASIEAEDRRLHSALIQQALRIELPADAPAWRNNEAQWEVASRLRAYIRLGLVKMELERLDDLLRTGGSLPVTVVAAAAPGAGSVTTRPPAPVATTPPDAGPSPAPAAEAPSASRPTVRAQRVYVQFAGSISRDQVIRMARELSAEWRVEGADRGGERTQVAAGLREVRWGHPDDEAAAKALADAVERTGIVRGEVAAKRVEVVRRGNLEIWISP